MKIFEKSTLYLQDTDTILNTDYKIRFSFLDRVKILFGIKINFFTSKIIQNATISIGKEMALGRIIDIKLHAPTKWLRWVTFIELISIALIVRADINSIGSLSIFDWVLICMASILVTFMVVLYLMDDNNISENQI